MMKGAIGVLLVFLPACVAGTWWPPALRGLNVFPHAASPDAIAEAVDLAIAEADVPAYLENEPNEAAEIYIAGRFLASGKPSFVATQYRDGAGHLDRCRWLLDTFQPHWFNYAIEANDLPPDQQAELPAIFATLKTEYPDVVILLSIQATTGYDAVEAEALVVNSDAWAVSIYPYLSDGTFTIPPRPVAGQGKPVIIAETAWPAEPFPHPVTGATVQGSPDVQSAYLSLLTQAPVDLFVWYVGQDYDEMFIERFAGTAGEAWSRVWRDTGLLDGDGNARPALEAWRRLMKEEPWK